MNLKDARFRARPAPTFALLASIGLFGCDDEVGLSVVPPAIEVEPTSVDFGDVQLGLRATREVFIRNPGGSALDLQISSGPDFDGGAFTFDVDKTRVSAGGVAVLTLGFAPQTVGELSASVLVRTNVPDLEMVEVSFQGRGVSSTLAVEPQRLDFRNVVVGATRTLPVTITNNSSEEARVLYIQGDNNVRFCSSNEASLFCVRFRDQVLDRSSGFKLASGESAQIDVQFSPVVAGTRVDGFFTLRGCESSACDVRVSLTGIGVEAGLRCRPANLDFGRVNPGESSQQSVACENIANEPVTLATWSVASGSGFSVETPRPQTLNESESISIETTFAPTALGDALSTLRIETDNQNPSLRVVEVGLRGTGGGPEIEVLPTELRFGRVSLLAPSRRSFVVTNTGFSPLTISEFQVDVDGTQAFSAPDASAGVLRPGESQTVVVEFQPIQEGPVESRVRIVSDDADEPTLDVPVRGEGVNLPPCSFSVAPSRLQFGAVQVTRTLRRSFEIRNDGRNACLLTSVRLVGGSTRAFALPDGDVRSVEIAAGSSKTVTVEFAPGQRGTETGQVEFSISSPSSPFNTVDLVGVGVESSLLIVPNELNFGTIGVGCATRAKVVTIYNNGASPVTVNRFELAQPVSSAFSIANRPAPLPGAPLTLPSGQSAEFQVAFRADSVGEFASAIDVETTVNGSTVDYIVALDGIGAVDARQIDEFEQLGKPKVDILFVVDKTTSMTQEQDSLAANFAAFIRFANAQALDYQIGSTTTNTLDEQGCITSAAAGTMRQSALTGPVQNRIVTPRTRPDPGAVFRANVSYRLTGGPPAEESGLRAAEQALSAPAITGCNAGLIRPDAVLSLIIVSDAADHSPSTVDYYVNFFRSIKGFRNTNLFSASMVAAPTPPGNCSGPTGNAYSSGRYQTVADQTGGVFVSICSPDWSRSLEELSQTAFGFKTRFFLTNQPATQTLKVFIGGREIERTGANGSVNWGYDLPSNSVNFSPFTTPEPGDRIRVEYAAECL